MEVAVAAVGRGVPRLSENCHGRDQLIRAPTRSNINHHIYRYILSLNAHYHAETGIQRDIRNLADQVAGPRTRILGHVQARF